MSCSNHNQLKNKCDIALHSCCVWGAGSRDRGDSEGVNVALMGTGGGLGESAEEVERNPSVS